MHRLNGFLVEIIQGWSLAPGEIRTAVWLGLKFGSQANWWRCFGDVPSKKYVFSRQPERQDGLYARLLRRNFTVFPSSRGSEPSVHSALYTCCFTVWGQQPSRRYKHPAFLIPLSWMAEFTCSAKPTSSFFKYLQICIDKSPKGLLQPCSIWGTRAKKVGVGWKSLTSPRVVFLCSIWSSGTDKKK